MKNILYFTGAGFSAPLGIPVMSNFVQRSKDLYQNNQTKYDYFSKVFELINDLSKVKLHIDLDLRNIEDIFSLLEMKNFIEQNSEPLNLYKKYIEGTITALTPLPELRNDIKGLSNWHELWIDFNNNQDYSQANIASFIKYLYGIDLSKTFIKGKGELLSSSLRKNRMCQYSMITLNYDTFPEQCIEFIDKNYPNETEKYKLIESPHFQYTKLHGSIGGNISIPSWNKVGNNPESKSWKQAYDALKNANEIRILGYSLPDTDAYVKYLFGISLKDSFNLQKIDVITLDSDGKTKDRFDRLFESSKILRFKDTNLSKYIGVLFTDNRVRDYWISDRVFETRHDYFMNGIR